MCIKPNELADGTRVACRECWQCVKNRINDYAGRCLAEQQTATIALPVTLTYSGDSPNNATLLYEDFQKFMKRLRRRGYNVRYIVAGEYGSKRGRAHWHAVLFFYGKHPQIVDHPDKINKEKPDQIFLARFKNDPWARNQWSPWSNEKENRGHVYFQPAEYEGFIYILKYAVKGLEDQMIDDGKLGMSKKPPLGYHWLLEKAERYVEQGIVPQNFEYSFPHVFDKKRNRRKFWLQGVMRDKFMQHYLRCWHERYGVDPPWNEHLENYGVWDPEKERVQNGSEQDLIEWQKKLIAHSAPKRTEEYYRALEKVEKQASDRMAAEIRYKQDNMTVLKGVYQGIPCIAYCYEAAISVQYGKDQIWHVAKERDVKAFLAEFRVHKTALAGDLQKLQSEWQREQDGREMRIEKRIQAFWDQKKQKQLPQYQHDLTGLKEETNRLQGMLRDRLLD